MPPLREPCDCASSVHCETDGDGEVLQMCLRCGAKNIVERRDAIIVSKRRAVELSVFMPEIIA